MKMKGLKLRIEWICLIQMGNTLKKIILSIQIKTNQRENKPKIGPTLQNIEVKQIASLEIGAKYYKKKLIFDL